MACATGRRRAKGGQALRLIGFTLQGLGFRLLTTTVTMTCIVPIILTNVISIVMSISVISIAIFVLLLAIICHSYCCCYYNYRDYLSH